MNRQRRTIRFNLAPRQGRDPLRVGAAGLVYRQPRLPQVLFRLAAHRRRGKILYLEPVGGAAAAVREQPLAYDAHETELLGVAKDDIARLCNVSLRSPVDQRARPLSARSTARP